MTQAVNTGQGGHFAGAHDITMLYPSFYDMSGNYNYIMSSQPVLERLRDAGTPEAGLDARARYPPPRCHPGTRTTIQEKLQIWLLDLLRKQNMIWLSGPAGVGKSAVAQTFSEVADVQGLLGAAFFFSETKDSFKRADPCRVIPTLAYQLAIHSNLYLREITQRIVGNPSMLDASLQVQFQRLIVEPFLQLASNNAHPFNGRSHVIVIDGLDECNEDIAQCELVELIREATQKSLLPFIWLVCSRPERHLKSTFSQLEYAHACRREELAIDDGARADVERFLRARFGEIHRKYQDIIVIEIGRPWPTEIDFATILQEVSGHFVVGSVAERYVGDPTVGNPQAQLRSLLGMLRGLSRVDVRNPLEALDAFYHRILAKVSEDALPPVMQVLALCAHKLDWIGSMSGTYAYEKLTAEGLWRFLHMDQSRFYSIMQRLHSVVDVPPPKEASEGRLAFYHKSFPDYLTNARRSGKFFVSKERAWQFHLTHILRWYTFILQMQNPSRVASDEHHHAAATLRDWLRGNFTMLALARFTEQVTWNYLIDTMSTGNTFDPELLDVFSKFNFNLLPDEARDCNIFPMFAFALAQDARVSSHFVRTEVKEVDVDPKLLHHLSLLSSGKLVEPLDLTAADPFEIAENTVRFVIVGQGSKSGLACIGHSLGFWKWQAIWLNTALPPTKRQRSRYQSWTRSQGR